MNLQRDETEIIGSWKSEGARVVADSNITRIRWLIANSLEKIAVGNWTVLYRDRIDGRFWQMYHPHGELQGGGPESLRLISAQDAANEYGLDFSKQVGK
jgi:hypothetical protein